MDLSCFKGCSDRLDITVIVDSSGSIRNERFPYVLDFISQILDQIHLEADGGQARVAALHFSNRYH